MTTFRVEPIEEMFGYGCPCCADGSNGRGFVFDGEEPHALYYFEWTGLPPDATAALAVVVGRWDKESGPEHRRVLTFELAPNTDPKGTNRVLLTWPELSGSGRVLVAEEVEAEAAAFRPLLAAIARVDPRLTGLVPDDQPAPRRFSAAGAGPA